MERETGNVIVLFLLEQLLIESHTWGNKFCNSSLDYVLGEFRILKLITDCHFVA